MMRERISVVYIIDDDESVLSALSLLMRVAGFKAQTFASAGDFLEMVTLSNDDCIILDLCMPGFDGFDLLKGLRDTGVNVPVIVLSALDDIRDIKRAIELGASAYFKKPVDDQALIDMIRWCMQKNPECKG
jgi:FixJ family two-component response regulator